MTVKLLLLDHENRVLLIRAADPRTGRQWWYPVGGGVEPGESLQQAAQREAYEEAGLAQLPMGTLVWTRDHTYRYDGRTVDVHEDWLHHTVQHFDPAPANLSDYETKSVLGFRWWDAEQLSQTNDTVFPPGLGDLLSALLRDGPPPVPVDITEPARS
ncbi:NUDIX hydrolase [Nocardioides terrigena]|uniref:NUDIX hydrolase n=1 Tax=Nocardioides terrigena TaxID=424797 RepID=UPI001F27318A|nr:NUDIX domain-containing protein [Nocardioides terrigena]